MTADDIDPAALAAIQSSVETACLLGGLVALLISKGIVSDEEVTAFTDAVRDVIVVQTATKYDLPVNKLKDILK